MDIIETNRLIFREFTKVDNDKLYQLLSDEIVMKYCFGPLDEISSQKWLDMVIECYKEFGYDYWAVYERETDSFIGQIGILNQKIDGQDEDCLAFMIGKEFWNKGYATEGARACLQYAFTTLKLKKVVATVEPENFPSIAVLKKIGMKYIGDTEYMNEKAAVYSISTL